MSNIDTKSIVSSLMAIERRPQDQLQSRISDLQRAQSAWEADRRQADGAEDGGRGARPDRQLRPS